MSHSSLAINGAYLLSSCGADPHSWLGDKLPHPGTVAFRYRRLSDLINLRKSIILNSPYQLTLPREPILTSSLSCALAELTPWGSPRSRLKGPPGTSRHINSPRTGYTCSTINRHYNYKTNLHPEVSPTPFDEQTDACHAFDPSTIFPI